MNKTKRTAVKLFLMVAFMFSLSTAPYLDVKAQCAMCSLTADNSVKNGNNQGTTLNKGIMLLLAAPYLAVGVVGFVWYRKYRRKQGAGVNSNPFLPNEG